MFCKLSLVESEETRSKQVTGEVFLQFVKTVFGLEISLKKWFQFKDRKGKIIFP